MNIKGMNRAELLAKLYNASKPLGLGFLQYTPDLMSVEEAQGLFDEHGNQSQVYFDYLKGRVMKVMFNGDELDTRLYNRDNGEGAAEKAIARG